MWTLNNSDVDFLNECDKNSSKTFNFPFKAQPDDPGPSNKKELSTDSKQTRVLKIVLILLIL